MKKKNILYLSPSNRWLGARISLYVLLKRLDKERFHPIIVCPSPDGDFAQKLEEAGFEVIYLRLWNWRKYKYIIHRTLSVLNLRKIIKEKKIDLIHCNEFWTAPYAYWSSRGMNIPLVSHVRLDMNQKKIKNYYLNKLTRIICVCKALVEKFSLLKDYRRRVVPIYNAINLAEYDPEKVNADHLYEKFNVNRDHLLIGLIAQISVRKGQDRLIRISPEIIKRHPEVRFLIVGGSREKEYEEKIHRMIRELGVGEHFIFTGQQDDMPAIYQILDIMVLPSQMEGFGRVAVEAQAMKVPVVVSKAGGLVEVVNPGATGYHFALDSDDEMLKRLLTLAGDPELRQKMGEAGRDLVKRKFSQEIMVEQVHELYREVLKNGSGNK